MITRLATHKIFFHLTAMALLIGLAVMHVYSQPAQARLTMETNLLVSTRDSFRVCLETSPGVSVGTAMSKIARGLQTVRANRTADWEWAHLGKSVPVIEGSCPGAKVPRTAEEGTNNVGPGATTNPSPYRTTFFVLDEATANAVLGTGSVALVPFEMMCFSHECATVTTALVVRESFLDHPDFLDPWLTISVGMQPNNLPQHEPGIK